MIWILLTFLAQADAAPADLSAEEEAKVEAAVAAELPSLYPVDDPRRIEQLWARAKRLTKQRAYCSATKQLEDIEAIQGSIQDNRSFAAQAYLQCASIRMHQGMVNEASAKLQRSISIVGRRTDHDELLFKLALVRVRKGIDERSLAVVEENLSEAETVATRFTKKSGMIDWARPLWREVSMDVATWSKALVNQDDERALQAAQLALKYSPNNRVAQDIERDIIMRERVAPMVGGVVAFLGFLALLAWFLRASQLKRATQEAEFADDAA